MFYFRFCVYLFTVVTILNRCPSIAASEKSALVLSEKQATTDNEFKDENGAVSIEDNADDADPKLSKNVFLPTRDWKVVKEGQAIPRGLHVRMNLATGEKEAKLIEDKKEENIKYWENEEGKRGMVNADGSKTFTRSQLKEALKKFEAEAEAEAQVEEEQSDEAIKSKFRSYDELKEDLKKLQAQVKSDSELMTDLLTEFKNPDATDEEKLTFLEDLEYLVHQIDNAQNFVNMGGFGLMSQLLNSTDPKFRELAAFVVGSAAQSNPKVQIAALDNGLVHQLIRIFTSEQSSNVRRKYLFAFSAILRHFPFAQKKFLDLGGFEVLGNVLQKSTADENHKIKIVTLLSDLLNERREIETRASTYTSASPIQKDAQFLTKLNQYREAPLKDTIVDGDWCRSVADLLSTPVLDGQEKVLRAMEAMFEFCRTEFGSYETRLRKLDEIYRTQLADNSDSIMQEFLVDLRSLVEDLLSRFGPGLKTEL